MPSFFDVIRDFFGGDDDDEDDEIEGALLDPDDWEGSEELSVNTDDWESEYIIDDPIGEMVNLPPMDYQTALEYCADAPEGVLCMLMVGDDMYEIYRTYTEE